MAHSSGGGSHSGGSHGGSHSYSSSSRSGSSSYSGTSEPTAKISRRRFKGASSYVYYDRRGRYHYIYSDRTPSKPDLSLSVFVALLFLGIGGGIAWIVLQLGFFTPESLNPKSYDSGVIIESHIDIGDESTAYNAMSQMLDITGVSPAVEIVKDSEWINSYTSLEKFAYSEYYRWFDDEKHWLVVVSYPDNYNTVKFIDWKWEGIIGDDCYPAVSSNSEEMFTTIFHRYMKSSSPETLSDSLASAYNEFSSTAMKNQFDQGALFIAGIIGIITILIVFLTFDSYVKEKKCYGARRVAPNAPEEKCEFCQRAYITGSVSECPGCGASLTHENNN